MANNTKNTVSKTDNTITFSKKTIALFIAAIGVLLMFIGTFGDILVLKSTQSQTVLPTINLNYIFKEGWDAIVDGSLTAGFEKFQLILMIGSFIVASLGVAIVVCYYIYKNYKKENINLTKSLALSMIFSFQYLVLIKLINSGLTNMTVTAQGQTQAAKASVALGWGSTLIVIGFLISLIGLIISQTEESQLFTQSNIANKVGVVLCFFIGLFGAVTMVKEGYKFTISGQTVNINSSTNPFIFILSNILKEDAESAAIAKFGTMKAMAYLSLIFSLISFGAFAITTYYFIKGDVEKDNKKLIGFASIFFITGILSNIFLTVAGTIDINSISMPEVSSVTNKFATFGSYAIVQAVLGGLLVISSVATVKLKDKTLKYVKSK